MGQKIPHALDAISLQMDEFDALLVEPAMQTFTARSLAQRMATFRLALRMAKSQFEVLERQLLSGGNSRSQADLLLRQQMIERSIASQFKICIVDRLEQLLNDQCSMTGQRTRSAIPEG